MQERSRSARPVGRFRSLAESLTADHLTACGAMWAYEPVTIHHNARDYTPDFIVQAAHLPRMAIEVKPSRAIASQEVRHDMLVSGSPLWMLVDLFVVATDEAWFARVDGGQFVECYLTRDDGLVFVDDGLSFFPANVLYGMPASWEDCQALGLDPITGQPEVAQ